MIVEHLLLFSCSGWGHIFCIIHESLDMARIISTTNSLIIDGAANCVCVTYQSSSHVWQTATEANGRGKDGWGKGSVQPREDEKGTDLVHVPRVLLQRSHHFSTKLQYRLSRDQYVLQAMPHHCTYDHDTRLLDYESHCWLQGTVSLQAKTLISVSERSVNITTGSLTQVDIAVFEIMQ